MPKSFDGAGFLRYFAVYLTLNNFFYDRYGKMVR